MDNGKCVSAVGGENLSQRKEQKEATRHKNIDKFGLDRRVRSGPSNCPDLIVKLNGKPAKSRTATASKINNAWPAMLG